MSGSEAPRRPDDDDDDHRPCPACGASPGQVDKIRELSAKMEELTREMTELKRRLSYYENSNSPPSKNSLVYRTMRVRRRREGEDRSEGASTVKKPGRKNGHEGATQTFRPTGSPVAHTMERCPRCNSTALTVASMEKRTVVDIPEPIPYEVKEHVINVYRCSGCGADGLIPESVAREIPATASSSLSPLDATKSNGVILGRNILSTVSLLWSVARLPQRKISYLLALLYRLELSPATVGHALRKVAERLAGFHEDVRKEVDGSERANFDETGVSVAGKRGWIWVAATERYAFVQVAMSRGRDVLERYFPGFRGVATVDGWRPYRYFALLQRCWSHILREAEVLAMRATRKEEAEALLSSLRNLFHQTKVGLEEHPPPNRGLRDRMLRRLRALLSRKYADVDVVRFVSKLRDASRDLFTFTLHPGVEPTNNHAERQLREPIVQRKIRGQLKSEEGMTVFSRLMTAVSTWKLQGLNPFVEFKRRLWEG